MRRSLSVVILLLLTAVTASSVFAQGPALTGEMVAKKIVVRGEEGEIALPAENVFPNDTVEYTLRYVNSGTAIAAGVDLIGPVPSGTVYIEKTATDVPQLTPYFSIDDGKNWQTTPVMYEAIRKDGTVEKKKATPDMITHVKWSMGGTLGVGEEVTVSYRVQVK
jgi:uncharacterized repeat protein (TIGR01451 family)